jgi:hypothetical protein
MNKCFGPEFPFDVNPILLLEQRWRCGLWLYTVKHRLMRWFGWQTCWINQEVDQDERQQL